MDPFVAEIRIFPFNFAPLGWAQCNGQLLPISQNTALFSLLGTFYGGDGKSTFALPDLQDAAAMFWGQGNGPSQRFLGEVSGSQTVTLIISELPAHTHTVNAKVAGGQPGPAGLVWGTSSAAKVAALFYAPAAAAPVNMNPTALSITGGSQPHTNMPPYLTMTYCMALQGVLPLRS